MTKSKEILRSVSKYPDPAQVTDEYAGGKGDAVIAAMADLGRS